jgi:hypothetical protein
MTAVWARMINFPVPNRMVKPAQSQGVNASLYYFLRAVSWDIWVGCVSRTLVGLVQGGFTFRREAILNKHTF